MCLLTMEPAVPEGCLLEWDSDPSVTAQLVPALMDRQVLISVASKGLMEDQTWILEQTLVTVAYDTHTVTLQLTLGQRKTVIVTVWMDALH